MRKKVLAIVTLAIIVLSLIPAGNAQAAVGMSPAQGRVGIEVTLSGLSDGIAYNIKWDDNSIKQGTAGSTGIVSFFVPESYGGEHTVKVEQPSGTQVFGGAFTVFPHIAIDPDSGSSGTIINIAGRGFGINEKNVAITYDGINIKSGITADANGSWSTSFAAPASGRGNHAIDASGDVTKGTDVVDKNFTVSPVVKMDPISGGVGTLVTITATGFASAESGIKVLYSQSEVRSGITAEVSGAWSTSFAVPASIRGSHVVNVMGNNTASKDIPDMVFTVAPAVAVTPNSGSVEDSITITGNGFANNENSIEITFDGKSIERNIIADDTGSWSASAKVPSDSGGPHIIGAFGRITPATDVTVTKFNIQSVLTVVPRSGNVNDELRVTGSGFNASKDYSIAWNDSPIASGTVNESGTFQSIFKAPGGKSGVINIVATDTRGATAASTFTMETTPPAVPQISSPKDGATIGFMGDTKVTFKWSDVSDPSGITYDLEVSDQSNFVKNLVSRSKLTDSKYTLSEAEALPNGEYYWRVRAIDGAGNVGNWSPSNMIKVGAVTTNTLIYIGIGVIILIILLALFRSGSSNKNKKKKKTQRDWE